MFSIIYRVIECYLVRPVVISFIIFSLGTARDTIANDLDYCSFGKLLMILLSTRCRTVRAASFGGPEQTLNVSECVYLLLFLKIKPFLCRGPGLLWMQQSLASLPQDNSRGWPAILVRATKVYESCLRLRIELHGQLQRSSHKCYQTSHHLAQDGCRKACLPATLSLHWKVLPHQRVVAF